jgi:hypothetical protein
MSDKTWLYGLTADEWLYLAAEGEASEVPPCCGNIGLIRDLLNALATTQVAEDAHGVQQYLGRQLITALEADGEGHGLHEPESFPLLHRVVAGVEKQLRTVT